MEKMLTHETCERMREKFEVFSYVEKSDDELAIYIGVRLISGRYRIFSSNYIRKTDFENTGSLSETTRHILNTLLDLIMFNDFEDLDWHDTKSDALNAFFRQMGR